LGACVTYGSVTLYASHASVNTDTIEESLALSPDDSDSDDYGEGKCTCIGIDGRKGFIEAVAGGKTAKYPADTGACCEKWDEGKHPACVGASPPGWCSKKWCYVDPCSCSLSTPPKASDLFPKASYHGRPLYFSYATCGAKDSYSSKAKIAKDTALVTKMCSTPPAATNIGNAACQCAGIANRSGTTVMDYGGPVKYPGAVGSYCEAWDKGTHPKCTSGSPPDWCSQQWCYVNPNACKITTKPTSSGAMKGASLQGNPLYFSYATCGGTNTYTAE